MSRPIDVRRLIRMTFEWISVFAGLLIIGSCTVAGFQGGKTIGFGMLLLGTLVALLVVGWVFLMTRMSEDVRTIRERLDALPPSEPPDPGKHERAPPEPPKE